ncbi:MAG: phosphonopyruvate decarboxylase [Proteobacteria bacterium]|nr:phosphonopyruvate decarboxylase [Pseudomonadota bacterium]
MIDTEKFGKRLSDYGYNFASGVPCSFLKYLINYAINDMNYVGAVNEGDAVAISAGAYMGGKKSMVLMQNSGLTNAISPLTSLNYPFRIPVLGFVSLRGEKGLNDEPQHELTGTVTDRMLEDSGVAFDYLAADMNEAVQQLKKADGIFQNNRPFFFIVRKNTFSDVKLNAKEEGEMKPGELVRRRVPLQDMTRLGALEVISTFKDDHTVLLASTGKGGRELYEIDDSDHNFYMVGSMGCISSFGLGMSLAKPNLNVIGIDGDGALLMRMGSMATNGFYANGNLLHILIDNNCHDSTGGQKTVSHHVDFPSIAQACGYLKSYDVKDLEELKEIITAWKEYPCLTFIRVRVKRGTKPDLGRPKVKPYEVKERLMRFIG